MNTPKKSLRQLAVEARTRASMTQLDLANRIGIPKDYISKYENGQNAPRKGNLQRYINFCRDMKWNDLVEEFTQYIAGGRTSRGGALSHEMKFALSFEDYAALETEAKRRGLNSAKMLVLDLMDRARTGKTLEDIGPISSAEEMTIRAVLNILRQVPGLPDHHNHIREFLEGLGRDQSSSLHK